MRPLPTTAEYLEVTAAEDGHRLALSEDGQQLSYGQLHAIVAQCGLALRELGVVPGARVAVSGPGFGIQLVLLLAAESLGAVTLSFQAEGDADVAWIFGQVDWVFSCVPQAVPEGVRFVHVDSEFARRLGQPLTGAMPSWAPAAGDAPQRIVRTSGSSGVSKFMVLSRQAQEWWIRVCAETPGWGMEPGTRYLVLSPLIINAAFVRVSCCLRRGGAVLVGDGSAIAGMDPTHISGLPLQLERLLAQLPEGYVAPRAVSVATFGGATAPSLRVRAEAVFGSAVRNGYGSNETGTACEALDPSGTGVLRAGIDVRVLGKDGVELPMGQTGIIALRTPAVPQGYIGLPEQSAKAFRDGWFVSGDVGTLVGSRSLRLAGRHDDLVNVGGIKVPAAELEAALREKPAIADAAVLAVHLDRGEMTMGVAIVLAAGASAEEGSAQAAEALQLDASATVRVLFVSALPQTAAGKLDRMGLLRVFQGV